MVIEDSCMESCKALYVFEYVNDRCMYNVTSEHTSLQTCRESSLKSSTAARHASGLRPRSKSPSQCTLPFKAAKYTWYPKGSRADILDDADNKHSSRRDGRDSDQD